MKTAAIICEYNPLHKGHIRQLSLIRSHLGDDCCILCLMSGCFVQRGEPAVFNPHTRAAAAVECGADLVLELPVTAALSSAEGFAMGGVDVLNRLGGVDYLCFGCESGNPEALLETARLLHTSAFSEALKDALTRGDSFAAARQRALASLGGDGSLLSQPNDILAVEYCKALLSSASTILPLAIHREGSYHAAVPDQENPSALSLRERMPDGAWLSYVPEAARALFASAPMHRLRYGERAILARLRAMDDAEFEALPFGSEGLWRRLMKQSRHAATVDELIAAVKSKRYARSRIVRMVLCAFLGICADELSAPAPYVRILAFGGKGRQFLRQAATRSEIPLLHAGQNSAGDFFALEQRCARLYPLFLPPSQACEIPAHMKVFHKK